MEAEYPGIARVKRQVKTVAKLKKRVIVLLIEAHRSVSGDF